MSHPEPSTLAFDPDQGFNLQHNDGQIQISWPTDQQIDALVLHQSSPYIDKDIDKVGEGESMVSLPLLNDGEGRYIYESPNNAAQIFATITFANGSKRLLSNRFISLERGFNFRDLGGYHTNSGAYTRWGRLYRSADMSQLTGNDYETLHSLGIKLIYDLRTTDEANQHPNIIPAQSDITYELKPIYERAQRSGNWIRTMLFRKQALESLWINDVYIKRFVEERAAAFGRVLTDISNALPDPAVFHCTAGKDRTGVTAALVLSILEVPRETIIADYTLSNLVYDELVNRVAKDSRRAAFFGIRTADLFPILTAQSHVMETTLTYIDDTYGSIHRYIKEVAKVSDETVNQLKRHLLTPAP